MFVVLNSFKRSKIAFNQTGSMFQQIKARSVKTFVRPLRAAVLFDRKEQKKSKKAF